MVCRHDLTGLRAFRHRRDGGVAQDSGGVGRRHEFNEVFFVTKRRPARLWAQNLGNESTTWGQRSWVSKGQLLPEQVGAAFKGFSPENYMNSVPSTIAGWSNEIQRNIIATRGLDLPRS